MSKISLFPTFFLFPRVFPELVLHFCQLKFFLALPPYKGTNFLQHFVEKDRFSFPSFSTIFDKQKSSASISQHLQFYSRGQAGIKYCLEIKSERGKRSHKMGTSELFPKRKHGLSGVKLTFSRPLLRLLFISIISICFSIDINMHPFLNNVKDSLEQICKTIKSPCNPETKCYKQGIERNCHEIYLR